jgi:mevalonate kinase
LPYKKTYYSNGKLLLTGEYLVLDGALALGLPTRFGQSLEVQSLDTPIIDWKSLDNKRKVWFETSFQLPRIYSDDSNSTVNTLKKILDEAQKQHPGFLSDAKGYRVTTKLDFPTDWGLGTSSTLLNNVAQWAGVDAFELLQKTMGGSGYDIACAQNNKPIAYRLENKKPFVQTLDFYPDFAEQLYFVHLNRKQQSAKEIQNFRNQNKNFNFEIETISELTSLLIKSTALDDFEKIIKEHELVMQHVLQKEPVQKSYFKDYFGQIKSLGAWGGDFILATGNADTPKYFKKKGYNTILLYDEMILG